MNFSKEDQKYMQQFGGYNDFPPNWNEITDQQFFKKWFIYCWRSDQSRQMMRPDYLHSDFYDKIQSPPNRRPIISARLFFYHDDTGLAITEGYDGQYNPRYFEFGLCMHKNKVGIPEKSRMCYHVSKCVDCDREFHIDSSD